MNRRSMSVAIVDSTLAFSMIDFVQRIMSPRVFVLEACSSTHTSTVRFSLVEFKVKKMVVVTFFARRHVGRDVFIYDYRCFYTCIRQMPILR